MVLFLVVMQKKPVRNKSLHVLLMLVAFLDRVLALVFGLFLLAWPAPGEEADIEKSWKTMQNHCFLWVARHRRVFCRHCKGSGIYSTGVPRIARKTCGKVIHARPRKRVQNRRCENENASQNRPRKRFFGRPAPTWPVRRQPEGPKGKKDQAKRGPRARRKDFRALRRSKGGRVARMSDGLGQTYGQVGPPFYLEDPEAHRGPRVTAAQLLMTYV